MDFPTSELFKYLSRAEKSVNKLTKQSNGYKNEAKYNNIKTELERLRTSKVHFFGVRFMGLGNRFSTLDMFIENGDFKMCFNYNQKITLL